MAKSSKLSHEINFMAKSSKLSHEINFMAKSSSALKGTQKINVIKLSSFMP